MAGLRELAELDLAFVLEDAVLGFGWAITLTNPEGISASFTGVSNDIAQVIDPDTGEAVSGRLVTISFRISTILAAGFELPRGIADADRKPWIVQFNDINGRSYSFKVAKSNPDRGLGVVTCILEVYRK